MGRRRVRWLRRGARPGCGRIAGTTRGRRCREGYRGGGNRRSGRSRSRRRGTVAVAEDAWRRVSLSAGRLARAGCQAGWLDGRDANARVGEAVDANAAWRAAAGVLAEAARARRRRATRWQLMPCRSRERGGAWVRRLLQGVGSRRRLEILRISRAFAGSEGDHRWIGAQHGYLGTRTRGRMVAEAISMTRRGATAVVTRVERRRGATSTSIITFSCHPFFSIVVRSPPTPQSA